MSCFLHIKRLLKESKTHKKYQKSSPNKELPTLHDIALYRYTSISDITTLYTAFALLIEVDVMTMRLCIKPVAINSLPPSNKSASITGHLNLFLLYFSLFCFLLNWRLICVVSQELWPLLSYRLNKINLFICKEQILFHSILGCPSTAGSSPPPESSIFLSPLLSSSIPLLVAPQCHLSHDVLVFRLISHPLSATLCF